MNYTTILNHIFLDGNVLDLEPLLFVNELILCGYRYIMKSDYVRLCSGRATRQNLHRAQETRCRKSLKKYTELANLVCR